MAALSIDDEDLQEQFILGSGSGGQKRNKTASCVHLQHAPSGISVKCQRARSRADNRYHARVLLCDKIEAIHTEARSKQQQAIDKIRRQKKRRSRRSKQRMLADKQHRAGVKQTRKPPSEHD